MPECDVMCLQQQIERECQRVRQRVAGRFVSVRHPLWSQEFKQIDSYREQLVHMIGKRQTSEMMCDISLGKRTGRAFKRRSFFSVRPVLGRFLSLCARCLHLDWQRVEDISVSASVKEVDSIVEQVAQKGDQHALQE